MLRTLCWEWRVAHEVFTIQRFLFIVAYLYLSQVQISKHLQLSIACTYVLLINNASRIDATTYFLFICHVEKRLFYGVISGRKRHIWAPARSCQSCMQLRTQTNYVAVTISRCWGWLLGWFISCSSISPMMFVCVL